MKIGLFGINVGPTGEPGTMIAVSKAAEDAGFESVWTGEHVVLPDPQAPPSPSPPLVNFVHPPAALAFIAAATEKLMLGTGITLLAQRNAVVLAKEIASVDYLSGGRVIFGVGAGYLKQEFDALGVTFSERGARTDEYLDAMRELWTSDQPAFAGRFVNFAGIQSRPKPARVGGPPIVMGGTSAAAYRRAITKCQGWYGFAMDFEAAGQALAGLAAAAERYERPAELGELEISITPRMATGPGELAKWEEMGVHRLILLQRGQDRDALIEDVDTIGRALIR